MATSSTLSATHTAAALCVRLGERVEAGGDRSFLLHGDDTWFVERGQVDVFSVRMDGGRTAGHRTHLLRVDCGGVLFGSTPGRSSRALLAAGTVGTTLRRVPGARLREASLQEAGARRAVHDLAETWIGSLCTALAREVAPKRCRELDRAPAVELPARISARAQRGVLWVKHLAGHSFLLDRDGLEVNGAAYVPLSHGAWLQARDPAQIRVVGTGELETPDEIWAGIGELQSLVVRYSERLVEEAERAEAERMARKAASQSATLQDACALLIDTSGGRGDDRPALPGTTRDPSDQAALLLACQAVGRALGIDLKAAPLTGPQAKDPLTGILRASRVRARRVALREDWWRNDHGPLLAFTAEGSRPVALLPSAQGYRRYDPATRETIVLDAGQAAALAPFGFTLYRPFGDGVLGLKDLVRFGLHGCRGDFALVVLMGLATALLGLLPPIAVGVLVDNVIPGARKSELVQLVFLLLACAFGTSLFNLTRALALLRVEEKMGLAIQAAVWDRLLSLPLPFFRPFTAGDLATRAMAIDAIRSAVSGTTITAVMGAICSLTSFGLMFHYSAELALWATLLIALALALTAASTVLQIGPQRRLMELQAKTSGLVLQLLSSMGKLKIAGAEIHAFALWARRFAEQRRLQFKARNTAKWFIAFDTAFPTLSSLVIFWIGLPALAAPSSLGTGDFLAFLSAYAACSTALLGAFSALIGAVRIVPLFEQARPILETRPEVSVEKADPGTLAGDIEMQHAVFRYQRDGPVVLKDLSFRASPGEFVALVGPSGSGKSTVLRLLLGFESLESGSIYFDGQDLDGLDVQAVRRQIGVVLQSGRLMAGDIFSNITAAAPATLEEAWEAARMAGLADDIRAMPMGMHTVVSEGGGTLSGGQRQRILIARAIVHRPRLLFFDEATSALDNRTQAVVSASLERLQATRIVIAHRLSTIVNADRIYVLESGRVVQVGSYSELVAQDGTFAEIARRQIT